MTTVLCTVAFLLYLAGIGLLAHLWPYGIRQHPIAQLAVDTNPVAACLFLALFLALITVVWPAMPLYTLIHHLTHRSSR